MPAHNSKVKENIISPITVPGYVDKRCIIFTAGKDYFYILTNLDDR